MEFVINACGGQLLKKKKYSYITTYTYKQMLSIAVFSQQHYNHLIRSTIRRVDDAPFIYTDTNGNDVIVTAIFNPETFTEKGYGELNQSNVQRYLLDNLYYTWSDLEYKGLVTKFKMYVVT
jgi:hypothetical protein